MKVKVKKNAICLLFEERKTSVRRRKAGLTSMQCNRSGGTAPVRRGRSQEASALTPETGAPALETGSNGPPKSHFGKFSAIGSLAGACHFQLIPGAERPAREKVTAVSCWLLNWVTVSVKVGDTFPAPMGSPAGEKKKTLQKGRYSFYPGYFLKS